ncbi:MAG TPA: heme NO-binding domain-containing protein [Gemmatimonadaceae bacterium]|nr:heme NO-binding domain-containing protein [Gemmatimonadaceae bacterium]
MQQVKGTILRARLSFVEEHFGKDAVKQVLDSLPPDDRKTLALVVILRSYPFELGRRLDDAIVTVLGGGRSDFFERLGEASAQKNLTTVHRSFLTKGDAHGFLSKAPTIYSFYYETGRREYERVSDREGVLTTFDAETFSAPDCLTVIGWHRKALEMCGVQGVAVREETCRAGGARVCRYRFTWS